MQPGARCRPRTEKLDAGQFCCLDEKIQEVSSNFLSGQRTKELLTQVVFIFQQT